MPAPDPRHLAALMLSAVIKDGMEQGEVFARETALEKLEPRDRAFTRTLISTVLRHHGELMHMLGGYISKMPKEAPLVAALELGAAQLLYLDTPPHAGVNATVDAVKRLGFVRQAGLVNAVLKKISADKARLLAEADPMHNLPGWLAKRLKQDYSAAVVAEMARAHALLPPLDITVKSDAEGWAQRLGGMLLPTGSVRLGLSDVRALEGYDGGEWWVQDAAAALPVRLLGDVRGLRVLDLCAAPGGKTLQLAAAGAQVTALDRSGHRLERLAENLARTGLTAEIIAADLLEWQPTEAFDAVLLDAPCTATGTLRRHPDVALHRKPSDVEEMVALQRAMLARAAEWVKSGGKLAYSVCSLIKAEGEAQAKAFEKGRPQAQRLTIAIPGLPDAAVPNGALRTLPTMFADSGGIDGFFACAWRL